MNLLSLTEPGMSFWHRIRPWLTNVALAALGFGLLLATRDLVHNFAHHFIAYSVLSIRSVALFLLAGLVVLTQPKNRQTIWIVLAFAIAFRLVTLLPPPLLSTDIYRYAWDGVVQHAGISPYKYVPGDPALAFLREPNQDLYDHMNRRDYAHTIYPPGAQILFYLITFLNPSVTFMRIGMILLEGLTVYALMQLLTAIGRPREQALLYAWCPLLVWEIGSSGHVDSAAMAFIALALLARFRKQAILTGAFLAAAVLVKFYPIVLLPALFRRGDWKMPATLVAGIVAAYACYLSVGFAVFGFLGGYAQEEGIQTGERYFLLEQLHHLPGLSGVPPAAFLAFCGFCFLALTFWCWRSCCDPRRDAQAMAQTRWFGLPPEANFLLPAFALGMTLMLLFSPHYPWYVAWLVPFLTLIPTLTGFAYVLGLFYLLTTELAVGFGPKQFLLNQYLYGWVLLAFAADVLLRRWPLLRPFVPAPAQMFKEKAR